MKYKRSGNSKVVITEEGSLQAQQFDQQPRMMISAIVENKADYAKKKLQIKIIEDPNNFNPQLSKESDCGINYGSGHDSRIIPTNRGY